MIRKIIALILLTVLTAGAAGCSAPKKENTPSTPEKETLRVAYDNTRFGDQWMEDIARDFEKQAPRVKVILQSESQVDSAVGKALNSGIDVPDIAVMQRTNWQYFAQKGWLCNLTSLYQAITQSKTNENSAPASDGALPSAEGYGLYNGAYYVLPWSAGTTGILYNADLFQKYGWKVPKTVSELMETILQIKQSGNVPFAWAGKKPELWNNVVMGWWAQIVGTDGVNQYLAMTSPEVYHQSGRLQALQQYEEILADTSDWLKGSDTMDEAAMMSAFFKGRAAMIPGTSWLASKYRKSAPKNFNMKMMALPVADGAADGSIAFTDFGDFVCMFSATDNEKLASEFIRFLYSAGEEEKFQLLTDTPQPLSGSFTASDAFAQSVAAANAGKRELYLYSDKPAYYGRLMDWPYSGMPYLQIVQGKATAESIFEKNYNYAFQHWQDFVSK